MKEARVAIAQLPPYAFLNSDNEAEGYMVDVTKEIMSRLGVDKITPTVTTFDAMISGLQADQFDTVSAGLSVTPERYKAIQFSNPVVISQDALYVKTGNPKNIENLASIVNDKNIKIAVLTGSSQEQYVLAQGVSKNQILTAPDSQSMVSAVGGGRADAFYLGQYSLPDAAEKGLEILVEEISPMVGIAIGFQKGDVELRDAFNEELEKARNDGTLLKLYEKWGYTNGDILKETTNLQKVCSECK